ncbi:MAG: hypothetical protein ACLT98_11190 [Eggerthellaceae bacterium]
MDTKLNSDVSNWATAAHRRAVRNRRGSIPMIEEEGRGPIHVLEGKAPTD